jgi:hypothetical protein
LRNVKQSAQISDLKSKIIADGACVKTRHSNSRRQVKPTAQEWIDWRIIGTSVAAIQQTDCRYKFFDDLHQQTRGALVVQ